MFCFFFHLLLFVSLKFSIQLLSSRCAKGDKSFTTADFKSEIFNHDSYQWKCSYLLSMCFCDDQWAKNANKPSSIKKWPTFWSLQINYSISIQKFSVFFCSPLNFFKFFILMLFLLSCFFICVLICRKNWPHFFLKISVVPLQFIVSDENKIITKTQFSIFVFFFVFCFKPFIKCACAMCMWFFFLIYFTFNYAFAHRHYIKSQMFFIAKRLNWCCMLHTHNARSLSVSIFDLESVNWNGSRM